MPNVKTQAISFDAFGRARVSDTGQRLDVEYLYNKQPDYFDEITNNGTVTYNGNSRDLTLSLSDANDGSYATMRSHPVPYTPGNSQLIDITGTLNNAGLTGGVVECFLRSNVTGSVTEQTVEQSAWVNETSGIDWSKSIIFSMQFQSLKVGSIDYTLVREGALVNVATITNDNIRATGYWQLASLPVYWRIYNDATYTYCEVGYGDESNAIGFRFKVAANASATLRAICCTVKSEGGLSLVDMPGLPRSIDNGITAVTASTTLMPILSIRPKSTFLTYANLLTVIPKSFTLSTNNPVRLEIIHNGTLTNPSWADVDTDDSCMEYDVSASAITGGHVVYSDYIATTRNTATAGQGLLGKTLLWDRQGSETGVLTIAAIRTTASDGDCLASFRWEELR